MKLKQFLVLLILISSLSAYSQLMIGVKLSGIAYHPKHTSNSEVYKWNLDKKGHFVGFASITITASYNFNQYIGIKAFQTFVAFDCGGKFSGISHIGLNVTDDFIGIKNPTHQLSASMDLFGIIEKIGLRLTDYKNDPNFIKLSKNKKWESLFVWHGGQIQYDYFYKDDNAISVNLLPGYPYIYTAAIGKGFRF